MNAERVSAGQCKTNIDQGRKGKMKLVSRDPGKNKQNIDKHALNLIWLIAKCNPFPESK